ncbi:MAG TPA: phage tail sheath subtilisin-like domain-containing protein, partial [Nitrososphaera sp.]
RQGPVNEPILIHSFGEFERIFGGRWKKSTMSYAVDQYFLNGGHDAIIVRVVHTDEVDPTKSATTTTFSSPSGGPKFVAANPGAWANEYEIEIDHEVDAEQDDPDPAKKHLFNLRVKDGNGVVVEEFRNISRNNDHKKFALNVLKDESDYVLVKDDTQADIDALTSALPPADNPYTGNGGSDGDNINHEDIKGSEDEKKGIYALDKADIFNLLCIPAPDPEGAGKADPHYSVVYTAAATYCKEKRRAILIADPPNDWNSPKDASSGIDSLPLARNENVAIYYPLIRSPDPNEDGRYRTFAPCGVVAGIIAKTDAQRGVWKAPAGIDAILTGVPELEYRMTDEENGSLNPLGINCLRVMPGTGRVVWGARTMKGADRLASQWKYLSVRRMALYIEESLYRGTQWVVFEPNDEPLWSQIRLNIGAFMHDLFTKGAFQGSTPKEAYLVKCDKETTTQYDIDRGIVNIVVGFAPLKPAEFVIIKIQQLAGQTEAQ